MPDIVSTFEYRSPRFRADFRVLVETGPPRPAVLHARCIDLSEDGLAAEILAPELRPAEIRERLEIGARVSIAMTLPGNSTTTKFSARVTNRKPDSYGFAFIFSSEAEQSYMREYFQNNYPSILRSVE